MILGVSGGRKNGSTDFLVEYALDAAGEHSDDIQFISLGDKQIEPCRGCHTCKRTGKCIIDDDMTDLYPLLENADAIIIGSPTYFSGVSGRLKCFMDRTISLRASGFKLKNKIGAAIAVGGSRNGGQERVISEIHSWMLLHAMIVIGDSDPTSHFGGICVGKSVDDVKKDIIGIETVKNTAKHVVEVLKLLDRKKQI